MNKLKYLVMGLGVLALLLVIVSPQAGTADAIKGLGSGFNWLLGKIQSGLRSGASGEW